MATENDQFPILVSAKEAALIVALRKYDFGTFTIAMTNGEPYRVVRVEESKLINASDGLKLKYTGT